MFLDAWQVFHLRNKIDSIISRSTPFPDADAPEDPESVRFWATVGGSSAQRESTTISATASARIETSGDCLASMVGGGLDVDAASNGAGGRCGNGPTLKALVDVANAAPSEATVIPKAKAKAKAVAQQQPKTPAEHRNALRNLELLCERSYAKALY